MKLKFILVTILFFSIASSSYSQIDSLALLLGDNTTTPIQLLPDHMMGTQRLLWGQKGLMRKTGWMKLTEENRQREMKIRRTMLVTHQVMGYATLVGMLAQGIVGAKLYKSGTDDLLPLHQKIAAGVNFTYFTTAGLSLFSPPPLISRKTKGLNSIKMHKGLAKIHLTGMITTNLIASQLEHHENLKPYHRAAAYTSFLSFAAAMLVMKF